MLDNIYYFTYYDKVILINLDNLKTHAFSKQEIVELKKCVAKSKSIKNYFTEIGLGDFFDSIEVKKDQDYEVKINPRILISYKCNYSCTYCFEQNEKNIKNVFSEKSIDAIDNFYDKYCEFYSINKEYGVISIYGGEPLLPENKNILLKILNKWPDKEFIITTNGTYITYYKELLSKFKINLKISLDGIKKIHLLKRKTTHEDDYDKTIKGIKWAIDNNIQVTILTVFFPENIEYYPLFFDLIESLGWLKKPNINIHFISKFNDGSDDIDRKYIVDTNNALNKLNKIDYRMKYASTSRLAFGASRVIGAITDAKVNKYNIYKCECLEKPSFTFTPTGEVYLCALTRNPITLIGKIEPEVFIDFERLQKIRKRNILDMNKCKNCKFRYICCGGCLVTAIKNSNDEKTILNPSCGYWNDPEIIKYIDKELVKAIKF